MQVKGTSFLQAAVVRGSESEQLRLRIPAGSDPCIQPPAAGFFQRGAAESLPTRPAERLPPAGRVRARVWVFKWRQRGADREHCRRGERKEGAECTAARHRGLVRSARWICPSSQLASSMTIQTEVSDAIGLLVYIDSSTMMLRHSVHLLILLLYLQTNFHRICIIVFTDYSNRSAIRLLL